jgi:hypothetical protein
MYATTCCHENVEIFRSSLQVIKNELDFNVFIVCFRYDVSVIVVYNVYYSSVYGV